MSAIVYIATGRTSPRTGDVAGTLYVTILGPDDPRPWEKHQPAGARAGLPQPRRGDPVSDAELDRIRARVAAARNRGEDDALVAVVLDEASEWRARALAAEEWRARALAAEAIVERIRKKRAAYAHLAEVAIDEQNREWMPAFVGALDYMLEGPL